MEEQYGAHNYHPLPVTIAHAEGAWVTDTGGQRYLDCLAGYSALNFGHRHPALIAAATAQLGRVTLTSRAFHHDQLGPFCAELAALSGKDAVLPMNSGAEAVETALKLARRWGYLVKGVPDGRATIIVADGNFHGRTISIISFSGDAVAHDNYGPYTPGFRSVPYGDAAALEAAIDDTTVAVLLEPVQGEAGVIVPPPGYLAAVREACTRNDVLMIADEIQSGLGRAGATFASQRAGVVPDAYILGKALGGGIVALSAVVTDRAIMDVITPGTHGSTFGGNPLAAAVGRAVVELLAPGDLQQHALDLEPALRERLEPLRAHGLVGLRVHGLWAGLDLDPALGTGRDLCEKLADHGVLAKDTHGSTIRLSPPLTVTTTELDWLTERLTLALKSLAA
nr:ornithine--oxo-acid transaminase [Kribbella italica]